jgi:anaerobic magnesium-protoporphyrin IX monomethyl ester cyclase
MSAINLINISIAKHFHNKVVYERNSAGVLSLLASLKAAHITVFFNEHFLDYRRSFDEECDRFYSLIEMSVSFIGIGCHSIHLPFVVKVAEEVKKRFPQKTIVLGGIGPSAVATQLMESFDFIDAVIIGEGEKALVELLQKAKESWAKVDGLIYRERGQIRLNRARKPIEDLDQLPIPAYWAVDFSQYEIPTIITSRGCPHACSFCSLCSFWGKQVFYRSIPHVINELKFLTKEYGVKYVFFGDPTFNLSRQRVIDLCKAMQNEGLHLGWECLVRADSMDNELMRIMHNAGCEAVFYGLESGSEAVYRQLKKGPSLQQALSIIEESAQYFNTVEVGLMWGFPFESLADFVETLRIRDHLDYNLKCEVQLRWLEPYPSTALYAEYRDQLFLPQNESIVCDKQSVEEKIVQGKTFYPSEDELSGIKITADVTNVRFVIAASHVLSLCREIIEAFPNIFSDYYRFRTPDLKEKIEIARGYSLY